MLKGSRLREIRKQKGLTQEQLGNLIGVGKSAICCYEKETRNPTIEVILELVHVLGVSADYLLGVDYLAKTTNQRKEDYYASLTKEEIVFINEIRKNKLVYDILFQDPRRGAILIKKDLG